MQAIETYVLRVVPVASIDLAASDGAPAATPGRDDVKAALRFDSPIAAAEVLVGPPGRNGRYPLVAGRDGVENARAHGREVVLAAIAPSSEALPRAMRRWQVYHAAA
jgi:hypothetical protein